MASFKAKFPVLQELFAKNHRGPFGPPPPSGARVNRHVWHTAEENMSARVQVSRKSKSLSHTLSRSVRQNALSPGKEGSCVCWLL